MFNEISTNSILTGSTTYSGISASEKNTKSVMSVYNSIKSSFGPMGLDKMLVSATGDVNVTNDGATILQNMFIEDPAAKMLIDLATNQDKEVGDGTTSVVLMACGLIESGHKLIESGIHPSVVVSGFRMAFNESVHFIKNNIAKNIQNVDDNLLKQIIKTCIASKILKDENDHFSEMVLKSIRSIENKGKYEIENINILKHPGGSVSDSFYREAYAMNCYLASPEMNKITSKVKLLCLDMALQKYKLPLTAQIVVENPEEMEAIRMKEIEITKKLIKSIEKSGANVVLTSKGIDDLCTKLLVEAGIVAIKRCKINDLEIIAQQTGTMIYNNFYDDMLDDTIKQGDDLGKAIKFNNDYHLGTAESLKMETIGNDECVFLYGIKKKMASLILRGPNSQVLEEMHRSLNDALNIVKRTLENKFIVPGGGAIEVALSSILETFALAVNSKEHISIFKFSEVLLNIPKILAINAGLDPNEIISKVLKSQKELNSYYIGFDATTGEVTNNLEKGIVEPMINKLKALRAATEAAISISRINEIIIMPNRK
ncbi:T-complex protein 1 subunit alpha [Nosema bombycis CQ1]|uniref:T-complex protein 1 subunit alpha n=1 Tax=Nosema bombycis (strain CQ1 / CVCC 102059) TaxID=578461 RepID=R0MPF6_NOSB1|nr:T-complex protein 1 subunit alpha [Nosema bombycis CQ1]|eukprot:EOB14753.1 T-complex protein 1 subunit alpha [Nosema bombycis CQ1]